MVKNKKGTWFQAISAILAPIFAISLVRWAFFEPFVIPSGSMIPTLLVHDHIFANKLSYGLHLPFSKSWIVQWSSPKPGDVVVFRYPETPEVYYIKRVVAVGGDEIEVRQGLLRVNGKDVDQQSVAPVRGDPQFRYFKEGDHLVRYLNRENSDFASTRVPPGSFFVMGDNRDQSNDSRYWGVVPEENLVGRAVIIWLSCDKTLSSAEFMCDPQTMRWSRMFTGIK